MEGKLQYLTFEFEVECTAYSKYDKLNFFYFFKYLFIYLAAPGL